MTKYTNNTQGARGLNLKSGVVQLVEAGQTAEIDDKDVLNAHPDLEKGETAAKKAADDKPAA